MKKIFFIALFLISAGNCFGQQVTFQKTYGGPQDERLWGIKQTLDSGFIMIGELRNTSIITEDCYLVKTDFAGNVQWKKIYGEAGEDLAYDAEQTSDGGFIMTGTTNSFGNNYNVYLIKINPNSTVAWSKTYGGNGDDAGYSVHQTLDGGYVVSGEVIIFGAGLDAYLLKTDSVGNLLWSKHYGGPGDELFGNNVLQTMDSGYVIMGSTTSFGAGGFDDIFIIRTDASGDTLWTRTYGGTDEDDAGEIIQTPDGGFAFTAGSASFNSDYDSYLVKIDSSGNLEWSKVFDGGYDDETYSISATSDFGFLLAGTTSSFGISDVLVIKTDSSGNTQWVKTYGGPWEDYGTSISKTNDNGFIVGGITYASPPTPVNFYLIKCDSLGNSGCYEVARTFSSVSHSTLITIPPFDVSIGPNNNNSPQTQLSNYGSATTLCALGKFDLYPPLASSFCISPNPTTNNFTITFPNTINKGSIEIYNFLGEKIFTEKISHVSEKEIYLKNINAGIYFVKVRDGEKEYCKKLVIK